MDYDLTSIPGGYDRGRDHGPGYLDLWMNVVATHVDRPVHRILDLGCGTGRFSAALATRFQARVIGIDPSERMLARAREKRRGGRVHYGRGSAEAIPIADASVDMIFVSMSFHHFHDPDAAAGECRRVLRADGRLVIRTGTREQVPSYPYVPFFPRTPSMLEELLPDRAGLCRVFADAGLRCVSWVLVTQAIAPTWAAYAKKLAAGGDSVIARLPEDELARGLEAVRQRDAQSDGGPVVEPIDVFVFQGPSGLDERPHGGTDMTVAATERRKR